MGRIRDRARERERREKQMWREWIGVLMRGAVVVSVLASGVGQGSRAAVAQSLAVRAETVYTMAGEPITDGMVLIEDGEIRQVGPTSRVRVPDGVETVIGKVVTPGLIDTHSTVGFSGIYNVDHDQDQLDTSDPIQPELRAVDAYNAREELVAYLRELGVTTVHTGHGPGALVSGQTMIVKTAGDTVEEAVVEPRAMVAMTLGPEVGRAFDDKPGTRSKGVAMLRQELIKAQEYARKGEGGGDGDDGEDGNDGKPGSRDLGLETLAQVLRGELPALVTAQRHNDILDALRLQREFGFEMVLDGAAEAYLVLDAIRDAGVPVLVHPPKARLGGATQNASLETPAKLQEAGIPFAFQSGYEAYVPKTRVILFEAAIAAANGLSFEDTLAALTIEPAKILGLDNRVGSLEEGKDADLAIFDGDPFEYTSHVCAVVIDGRLVSETCR